MKIIVTYRNKRSGLSMRVSRQGEVRVSAPLRATESEIRAFVESNRQWIERAAEIVKRRADTREAFFGRLPLDTSERRADAKRQLMAIVSPMVVSHSQAMGISPSRITFRATRTRWGSCNKRLRTINFSYYLLLLPTWCVEHVVVHELAHLIEANHGPRFYALMERHYPRWREARAVTRRLVRLSDTD